MVSEERPMKYYLKHAYVLLLLFIFVSCADIRHAKHADGQLDNTSVPNDNSTVNQIQVEAPTMNVDEGSYSLDINVTISSATAGATIYYTANGQDPTTASTIYSAPISITGNGTSKMIKAIAIKDGMSNSNITNKNYVINYSKVSTPSINLTTGSYDSVQNVEITCLTNNAEIHYTIDGTTPLSSSAQYSHPFKVSSVVTVKAIALKSQMSNSDISSKVAAVPAPGPSGFTCDDLKAINRILFITFAYDKKYDLDNDGKITVQDKLIIENDLLEENAPCVTALRTCDDLQVVKDEVQNWTDMQSFVSTPYIEVMKSAIAYSIIFNESGINCANDFNTGSFIGDVNKNGYLDCNDPVYIKQYAVGNPVEPFDPLLADLNASNTITGTDALIDQIMLNFLFNDYMDNLGSCPQ